MLNNDGLPIIPVAKYLKHIDNSEKSPNTLVNIRQNIIEEPKDKITEVLSKYTEKKVNRDKSVTYTEVSTIYFLENDKWNIDFS